MKLENLHDFLQPYPVWVVPMPYEFSDEELTEELGRRGYKVTKNSVDQDTETP